MIPCSVGIENLETIICFISILINKGLPGTYDMYAGKETFPFSLPVKGAGRIQ